MSKSNKFDLYEVIKVLPNDNLELAQLMGERGTILGMAQNEESKEWSYSISLESSGEVWCVREVDMEATGEVRNHSDFYTGESVKVRVDPETGEGSMG